WQNDLKLACHGPTGPVLPGFVGPYPKRPKLIRAERRRQRHIGGGAAPGPQYPSTAGDVVAGVEGVPRATQVNLEPGAEIHGRGRRWYADITEVSCAIPRRD